MTSGGRPVTMAPRAADTDARAAAAEISADLRGGDLLDASSLTASASETTTVAPAPAHSSASATTSGRVRETPYPVVPA